ncbi:MAG: YdcF family protein [Clostridiales bacterium]|jgi:uncharacterized SAM-binding protein YcdF (DUF218 family)|nr:YdcF family protein [Clostridiales bacterium]
MNMETRETREAVIKEYRYIEPRFAPSSIEKPKPDKTVKAVVFDKRLYKKRRTLSIIRGAGKIALLLFSFFCIGNGIYCLLFLPRGIGSILPLALGCFILAYFGMEDHIRAFLRTKAGHFAGIAAGIIISAGLASFLAFVIATHVQSIKIPDSNRDVIIVLGGGLIGDRLSTPLELRLKKALEYAKGNAGATYVVSGGQGPGETMTEARAMANYLIENGVPEENIVLEEASTSTHENFLFSKELLDEKLGTDYTVVFVTNNFHVLRASRSAKKAGLDAQTLACSTRPFFLLPNNYFREYIAILYYLVQGRV